jgi:hypothetical protein
MRIYEILFWNDEPTDGDRSDPQLHLPPAQFSGDLTNLAHAFTRSGLVKHFWNLNGSEGQPPVPARPDGETELIPSGTLEPTTASWQAEPVENEPPVGRHRPIPYRQHRGMPGDRFGSFRFGEYRGVSGD